MDLDALWRRIFLKGQLIELASRDRDKEAVKQAVRDIIQDTQAIESQQQHE